MASRSFELPDLSLVNATYVLDRGSEQPLHVVAGEIAIYDQLHKAVITNLSFSQNDADGNLILSGHADSAEVDTTTHDATLQGSIRVEKQPEEFVIEAESLNWLGEEQQLVSTGDTQVTVWYQNDKQVTGIGMTATLDTLTITFKQLVEGVIHQ